MAKRKQKRDEEREDRIAMEIVVDAYDEQERAIGWYCYLENQLQFPFTATCIVQRESSPLSVGDEVEVVAMPKESECAGEMRVMIYWGKKRGLAVPLAQLKPYASADEGTRQAVADWHYWVRMGYQF